MICLTRCLRVRLDHPAREPPPQQIATQAETATQAEAQDAADGQASAIIAAYADDLRELIRMLKRKLH
ncbi:hypothetical protein WI560_23625 [Bradyrhizobium sp. A11]|uniref:hypothetical protein n=1 Tax=Bradyrhizobium sp. A11 TaxID=3133974 RepID=UPI00324FA778